MGPSEDMNPTTHDGEQLQQEEDGSKILQGVSSNGTHHHHLDEEEEEKVLAQEFESLVLQGMTNDTHMMMMVMEDKKVDDQVVEEQEEEGKSQLYPLRPYAEDCSFYIKTGTCKFGQNCRFNHPSDRPIQYQGKGNEESNGTIGDTSKIDCKYFRTAGGCRYGDSCRYKHSPRKLDNEGPDLNFLGLPIRPSEQECAFYLRNGSCGYGANCRFNHPDPTAVKESEPKFSTTNVRARNSYPKMYANEPFQSSGVSQGISDLSNGLNLMNGLPYAAMNYYQAVPQQSGWNQDQANLPSSVKMPLPHQIFNISQKSDPSTHYEQVIQSEEFPLRPGQPDCDYFMKTGDCKYRADCRFNHPVRRSSKLRLPQPPSKAVHSTFKSHELPSSNPVNTRRNGMLCHQQPQFLNGTYPERPGQPECEFFMKTGNCKFKAACKYHHPKDRTSTPSCAANEGGIRLRPGAKICRNYEQQGTCKYGQNCHYHHPDNISPETADHVPQDASEVENHSSSEALTPVTLESSSNNMESDWGDGWVI